MPQMRTFPVSLGRTGGDSPRVDVDTDELGHLLDAGLVEIVPVAGKDMPKKFYCGNPKSSILHYLADRPWEIETMQPYPPLTGSRDPLG